MCALLCLTVCFCVSCAILSPFHSPTMPPMYSQNMGLVVTPLKKLKCLSRQKQSVEAHKYSCGYATDGSPFIQPRFSTEGFSLWFLKHFCFPQWEAPSTTLLVTLSICPCQELRGTLPREPCWLTPSCNCLLKQETDKLL